ncbi:hypothetical protein LZ31DRAFT_113467 [Colletotrichum somersetense]|nr:hypothetical protein LZ31DRAFT_113467 [Colletotrichum somersetense]
MGRKCWCVFFFFFFSVSLANTSIPAQSQGVRRPDTYLPHPYRPASTSPSQPDSPILISIKTMLPTNTLAADPIEPLGPVGSILISRYCNGRNGQTSTFEWASRRNAAKTSWISSLHDEGFVLMIARGACRHTFKRAR